MKSSRLVAFEVIHKIFTDNSYSNIALDAAIKNVTDDKGFISALVYGVIERQITLDYYINKYLTAKPKSKILTILRMGAYQILFMDKVPNSAAINESVKLVKEIKQDYYTKLVNAVLHKIDLDNEEITDDSIKYSIPKPLLNMWYKQYGEEITKKFLPNINGRPPIFAVPNTLYVDAEELLYELMCENIEGEIVEDLVLITSGFDLSKSKAFRNGLFHIEDKSSYECAKLLGAEEGETVLDICSAPGGKAFTISEFMKNTGNIFCYDLYESRLKLVDDGAKRLGITNIHTSINNGEFFNKNIPLADKILCDVVCSGFGIIRRKPEIKYKNLDDTKDLPELQLKILTTSSRYLKTGGTIVYSTCTLNKKENEKVVNLFLKENNDFQLICEKTTFPSKLGGDGFYCAKLIKLN